MISLSPLFEKTYRDASGNINYIPSVDGRYLKRTVTKDQVPGTIRQLNKEMKKRGIRQRVKMKPILPNMVKKLR